MSRPPKRSVGKKSEVSQRTPITSALQDGSLLEPLVRSGLGAVESAHRGCLAEEIRPSFADSLNLDAAMSGSYPQENRWDYLLGHEASGQVIGVEPHSARTDQVSVVIAKRVAAGGHLRDHLREGARVAKWIWVASGRVDFLFQDRVKRRLASEGIDFVGGQVKAKDLQGLIFTEVKGKRT